MFNIIIIIICVLSLNSCKNDNLNKESSKNNRAEYECSSKEANYEEKYDWFNAMGMDDFRRNFPYWLYKDVIQCYNFNERYELFAHDYLNPFFVYGDFNGDCSIDVAFFARDRNGKEVKLCVIHQNTKKIIIIDKGLHDCSWVDNIDVLPKNVGFSEAHSCIELKGDALWIGKSNTGAGGWIYWNGNDYNFVNYEAGMGVGLEEKKECVDSTDITENIGCAYR